MNTPENAVIAKLLATTAITNLVGQRVYPRIAPQKEAKPYLIVLRPEGQVNTQLASGLYTVSWTPIVVACVGNTYNESRTLSGPVTATLNPPGWTGSQTWGSTEVAFDQSTLPQLADEIGAPVEFVAFDLEHAS
jgi:hypothetical protein